jgi:hypothetical protein
MSGPDFLVSLLSRGSRKASVQTLKFAMERLKETNFRVEYDFEELEDPPIGQFQMLVILQNRGHPCWKKELKDFRSWAGQQVALKVSWAEPFLL